MAIDVSSLALIMKQAVESIDELLILANNQFQALKEGNIEKIAYVTSQQESVSRRLVLLDSQGQRIIKDFAEAVGLDIDHFNQLLPCIDEASANYLGGQRDAILAKSKELQEINELNSALVNQGLKYTQRVLGIVNSNDPFVYNRTGDVRSSAHRTLVDTKF